LWTPSRENTGRLLRDPQRRRVSAARPGIHRPSAVDGVEKNREPAPGKGSRCSTVVDIVVIGGGP
jgi:hypothetical protein